VAGLPSHREEFDKFVDDALLAQHLCNSQDQVGRRRTRRQAAIQAESNNLRDQHRDRLT